MRHRAAGRSRAHPAQTPIVQPCPPFLLGAVSLARTPASRPLSVLRACVSSRFTCPAARIHMVGFATYYTHVDHWRISGTQDMFPRTLRTSIDNLVDKQQAHGTFLLPVPSPSHFLLPGGCLAGVHAGEQSVLRVAFVYVSSCVTTSTMQPSRTAARSPAPPIGPSKRRATISSHHHPA